MNKIKEKLYVPLKRVQFWFLKNTRTREQRFWFTLAAAFFLAIGIPLVLLVIALWKIFLGLLIVFLLAVVVTSPIWIWVLRGDKR